MSRVWSHAKGVSAQRKRDGKGSKGGEGKRQRRGRTWVRLMRKEDHTKRSTQCGNCWAFGGNHHEGNCPTEAKGKEAARTRRAIRDLVSPTEHCLAPLDQDDMQDVACKLKELLGQKAQDEAEENVLNPVLAARQRGGGGAGGETREDTGELNRSRAPLHVTRGDTHLPLRVWPALCAGGAK